MNISNRKSNREKKDAAARVGLEASLTAAITSAQILGDADAWDRLLLLKRDVIRRHRRDDRGAAADSSAVEPATRGLFAVHQIH